MDTIAYLACIIVVAWGAMKALRILGDLAFLLLESACSAWDSWEKNHSLK